MNNSAKEMALPQTVGLVIAVFFGKLFFEINKGKDFGGSVAIALVVSLILSPFIFYLTYQSSKKILQNAADSISKAADTISEVDSRIGVAGFTELMALSVKSDLAQIRNLINLGEELNVTVDKGYSALMYASSVGAVEAVKLLIESGADKHIKTKKGNTAVYFAKRNGHKEIERILV